MRNVKTLIKSWDIIRAVPQHFGNWLAIIKTEKKIENGIWSAVNVFLSSTP